ncbi:MAG: ornithine carbamoyltransferase [Desulfobulbaceae bacterium]|jgi:ornithine carbamoyltransferase|nr:ornithine carbamoyltransferase [Desulfobulbaceae bacterium]
MTPRHLLTLEDFSGKELRPLIDRALVLKNERQAGVHHQQLSGKIIGMIFEKPSTRTRASFEAAMYGLGGQVMFLSARDTQLARSEPLKDTARVMSRYVDGLVVRTFGQSVVEELAAYSSIPVINALTDLHHPCQVLSDVMTMFEKKGDIASLRVAWVGDGNNMANSWIQAAGKLGFSLTLACPEGYEPDAGILAKSQAQAAKAITLGREPAQAVKNADVVNVDVWASMGQEDEQIARRAVFSRYRLDDKLMALAAANAIVMHCLPVHRGEEISESLFEAQAETIFDQAENKMHMHKAILEAFL